jgi:hypothetical protein
MPQISIENSASKSFGQLSAGDIFTWNDWTYMKLKYNSPSAVLISDNGNQFAAIYFDNSIEVNHIGKFKFES